MTATNQVDMSSSHLDLGCGAVPRNPYRREQLFGVDIRRSSDSPANIHTANLTVDSIPFEDCRFDSVSAFDFFEHIPRIFPTPDGESTRFPFVELMNEVYRVLKPGGLLYALTPAYPASEAFQDPTHVNIISENTHLYFTGDAPLARMYGFVGTFSLCRAAWVVHKDALHPADRPSIRQRWRHLEYRIKGGFTHIAWEFAAVKSPS
jgi:SAM-dependent methyltransferase